MIVTTKAGLARRLGVNRARISQLIEKGLPVSEDGKIDLDAAIAWVRAHASAGSKILAAVQSASEPAELAPSAAAILSADDFLESLLSGQFTDKAEAERIKENALAGLRTLELKRKAGELVEMETAKTVMFESCRAYRDALLQWPMSVGPMLAADLDVPAEAVTERLNAYVRQFLESIGEPDASAFVGE